MHLCFEAHKSMYIRTYDCEYWEFIMTTKGLGLEWL